MSRDPVQYNRAVDVHLEHHSQSISPSPVAAYRSESSQSLSPQSEEVELPVYSPELDVQEEHVAEVMSPAVQLHQHLTFEDKKWIELVDVLPLQKLLRVEEVEESSKVSPLELHVLLSHCLSANHEQSVYQVTFQVSSFSEQVTPEVHALVKQPSLWFLWWKDRDKELKSQVCRILRTEFKVSPSVVGWYDPLVDTSFQYPFNLIIIFLLILLTIVRIYEYAQSIPIPL